MLDEPVVQFVAIADCQDDRREAVKDMADKKYGNQDCAMYRDFREMLARQDIDAVLIATGDRWHTMASIYRGQGRQGHLLRKALLDDDRREPGPGRHDPPLRPRLPGRHAAAQHRQLHLRRRPGAQRQARQAQHRPRQHAAIRHVSHDWLPGRAGAAQGRGRLGHVARPVPLAAVQHARTSPAAGAATSTSTAAASWNGAPTRSTSASGPARPTTRRPVEYRARRQAACIATYANGVKLVMRDTGWMGLGTCSVRYEGEEGWVETGDSGRIEFSPASLRAAAARVHRGRHVGRQPRARLPRLRQDAGPGRTPTPSVACQSHIVCHAAYIAWQLGRTLTFDPVKDEFVGDEEANRMRSRAMREPWRI